MVGACFFIPYTYIYWIDEYRFNVGLFGILDGVPCAAGFSVVNGDHPCAAVNHPNVSRLIAAPAPHWADGADDIGVLNDR